MKNIKNFLLLCAAFTMLSCNNTETETSTTSETTTLGGGQSTVVDDESQKDVVKVAAGSPDHTTLVAAVKQADLVNALSNAGPFTVFAPTNAAFDKVGKATIDNLMKNENKEQLQDILQYHVYVGILRPEMLYDGQTYNQVNGGNINITHVDGKIMINNTATVVASIRHQMVSFMLLMLFYCHPQNN
jgi:uncharacterized surface protein with fasciclin (FAS1) repeats